MRKLIIALTLLSSFSSFAEPLGCKDNVDFEQLQDCARGKGIEISRSTKLRDTLADRMAPIVMSCLNTYFFLTKDNKSRRGLSEIHLGQSDITNSGRIYSYAQDDGGIKVVLPGNYRLIQMEEIVGNYYVSYELPALKWDECVDHLMQNGVFKN